MDEADKGRLMTTIGVSGCMFLLVPAQPGCPRQNPERCKTVVCVCVCEQGIKQLNTAHEDLCMSDSISRCRYL